MAMDNFTRFLVRTDSSSKLVDAATADLALAAKGRGSGTMGKADSSSKEVAQTGAAQNPKKPSRTSSMAKLFGGIGGVFGKKKNSKAMAATATTATTATVKMGDLPGGGGGGGGVARVGDAADRGYTSGIREAKEVEGIREGDFSEMEEVEEDCSSSPVGDDDTASLCEIGSFLAPQHVVVCANEHAAATTTIDAPREKEEEQSRNAAFEAVDDGGGGDDVTDVTKSEVDSDSENQHCWGCDYCFVVFATFELCEAHEATCVMKKD